MKLHEYQAETADVFKNRIMSYHRYTLITQIMSESTFTYPELDEMPTTMLEDMANYEEDDSWIEADE